MKKTKQILCLATLLMSTLAASSAMAGSWKYGCTGKLANGDRIFFNRDQLVTANEKLTSGAITLADFEDEVGTFEADDNNSGLVEKISFTHTYGAGEKEQIELTEKSSRTVQKEQKDFKCTANRSRSISNELYLKTYEVKLPMLDKPETVKLRCYEHVVSACG